MLTLPADEPSKNTAMSSPRLPSWVLVSGLAALMLAYPGDAHAYLDVGAGSMLLQAAIASAVAASFLAKSYWRRLKAMVIGHSLPEDDKERRAHSGDESS